MSETLLTRLVSYSQNPLKRSLENFTTEVLAHLINKDRKFQTIFVRHIIGDWRIRRRFKRVTANSQQGYGNGIVDLVLSSKDGRVLVEVKIGAAETETKIYGKGWEPQVQKYLDYKDGFVAYLTTKAVSAPDVGRSKRFLDQCYFEGLYEHLAKAKLTDVGNMFVQFMEENGMKSLDPFTQKELDNARRAFSFAKKCEAFLDEIKSEVEPKFHRTFGMRNWFTRPLFNASEGSAYIYTGKLRNTKVREVGIYIEPLNGKLVYGVYLRVLRTDITRLKRELGRKWKEEDGWLYSFRLVKSDTKGGKCSEPILRDFNTLRQALNQAY